MAAIKAEDVRDRLGNIDQVRELLFGHIVSDYEQRFDNSIQRIDRLESELSSFQAEMRASLAQLQESLTSEFRSSSNSLEKQVQYLTFTSHEQTNHLQYRVHEIEQKSNTSLESIHQTVSNGTNSLKNELLQTKEEMEIKLRALEKRVFEEIDRDLSIVKDGKISRVDLADLLFELCLKIKGADLIPALAGSNNNSGGTEYLLPEQSENG
jgi:DNA anti-recombination protein RmuC